MTVGLLMQVRWVTAERCGCRDHDGLVRHLAAKRTAALRAETAELPPRCQQLIALLTEDPPLPYAEISARLGISVSGIGPSRRHCLDKIRRHPAVVA